MSVKTTLYPPLNESQLKATVPIPVIYRQELPSTNDYMMGLQAPNQGLSLIVTDYQTKGKGQAGRSWVSESGANLLFSILYLPKSPMKAPQQAIEQFTLEIVRALAVALGGFLAGSFDISVCSHYKFIFKYFNLKLE